MNPLIGAFVAVVVRAGADLGAVTLRTPSFDNEDTIGKSKIILFKILTGLTFDPAILT